MLTEYNKICVFFIVFVPFNNFLYTKKYPIKNIISIVVAAIMSFGIVYMTTNKNEGNIPIEAYRVYLDGKVIGLIESKEELENYIDKQQESLKQKYHVDKIYMPNEMKNSFLNVIKAR